MKIAKLINKDNALSYSSFLVMMIVLGSTDVLRGAVAPVFQEHFALGESGIANIIIASSIGAIVFLFFGGKLMDKIERKPFLVLCGAVFVVSALFMCLTNNYLALLIGWFLAKGASSMMSASMSMTTPLLFKSSPAFMISLLYVIQGIGVSATQSVVGNVVNTFESWHGALVVIILVALVAIFGVIKGKLPRIEVKKTFEAKEKDSVLWKNAYFLLLVLVMFFYYVAEHGVLDWFVSYGVNGLGLEKADASNIVALFIVFLTIGRFAFSPLVDKIGATLSLKIFTMAAAVLFLIAIFLKEQGLFLVSFSGLAFSISYPTMLLAVSQIWPVDKVGGISGKIISLATIGDISFNLVFGNLTEMLGYDVSIMILPFAMVCCAATAFVLANYHKRKMRAKNSSRNT